MYCKHCGKEIADTAFMCPDCGTPTNEEKVKPEPATVRVSKKSVALSSSGFMLSVVGFVTGIIFGALFLAEDGIFLLYIIGVTR